LLLVTPVIIAKWLQSLTVNVGTRLHLIASNIVNNMLYAIELNSAVEGELLYNPYLSFFNIHGEFFELITSLTFLKVISPGHKVVFIIACYLLSKIAQFAPRHKEIIIEG
jgi:hypothetical protein